MNALYPDNRPLILAHRGALYEAPENTVPAFQRALARGADGVELDVTLSADGAVVVIHDDTLDRTTSGSGLVSTHTLAELKQLEAGEWFTYDFLGVRIPTLAEVFEALPGGAVINIELKPSLSRPVNDLPAAVLRVVRAAQAERRVLYSSFNPLALWQLWWLGVPKRQLALIQSDALAERAIGRAAEGAAPMGAVHPPGSIVTAADVKRFATHGWRVNTWLAASAQEDEDSLRALVALGVDGIITNRPDLLRALLDDAAA